jgi:hypothetical protein
MAKSKKVILRVFAKCEGCKFLNKLNKGAYGCKKGRDISWNNIEGMAVQPKPDEKCEK